jgi:hypothetical protein
LRNEKNAQRRFSGKVSQICAHAVCGNLMQAKARRAHIPQQKERNGGCEKTRWTLSPRGLANRRECMNRDNDSGADDTCRPDLVERLAPGGGALHARSGARA